MKNKGSRPTAFEVILGSRQFDETLNAVFLQFVTDSCVAASMSDEEGSIFKRRGLVLERKLIFFSYGQSNVRFGAGMIEICEIGSNIK